MKKPLLLLAFILLFATKTFSQDTNLSATLSYPLPIGNNFLKEYTGYIDFGIQYRFWDLNIVKLGVSANTSLLGVPNPKIEGEKRNALLIYPRIFGEFQLGPNGKFKPILGIGYGFNRFNTRSDTTGAGLSDINRTYEGVILNLGASYDLSDHIFIIFQYDWAEIDRSFDFAAIGNEKYDSRGNILKLGLGYSF